MRAHYPAGSGTYSKARSQFPSNAPEFAVSGAGGHILASDGREYIDWTAGLGAISLGYGDTDVMRATQLAAQNGNVFGLPNRLEFDYADAISEILPWGDDSAVKYGKHGSDVTSAAVRAARFITGRDQIISVGYHGWHGEFVPNGNGVPKALRHLTLDAWNTAYLDGYGPCAALIVEPEDYPYSSLLEMRDECSHRGMLLIFDEVLTGFRTPGWTIAQWKGVTPDYLCLAKAIGNGWPLSVIAGPSELMKPFAGDIGYSFTFGGECVSLAAGVATLRKYQREPVIARLWQIGERLRTAWDALGTAIPLTGNPSRLVFRYPNLETRTLVSQEFIRRGILSVFGFIPMYAHTEADIERTISVMADVSEVLHRAGDDPASLVEGALVQLPYRQMVTL